MSSTDQCQYTYVTPILTTVDQRLMRTDNFVAAKGCESQELFIAPENEP